MLYPVAAAKRPRLTAEAAGVLAGVSSGGVTEAILAQRLTDHVERIDSDMASCSISAACHGLIVQAESAHAGSGYW